MTRFVKTSNLLGPGGEYRALQEWPRDCYLQAGGHGIVIDSKAPGAPTLAGALTNVHEAQAVLAAALIGQENPRAGIRFTAFFEAFPKDPPTFIRGEGATIEEAECDAWGQFQKIRACPAHEFEQRDYQNGGGICKHCGLFQMGVIPPVENCYHCDQPTWGEQDNKGRRWCEKCAEAIPEEDQTEIQKLVRRSRQQMVDPAMGVDLDALLSDSPPELPA